MTLLLEQLKRHEGLRLRPYRDTVGKLTIGYGRNLDDVGLTQEEATLMLLGDIGRTRADLSAWLPWWHSLDAVRQDVLINMAFNLGIGGLLKFERMLKALRQRDYEAAATEMLRSVWATQVKGRADELAYQMRYGRYCL